MTWNNITEMQNKIRELEERISALENQIHQATLKTIANP
jgi:prefoldin subunit 5